MLVSKNIIPRSRTSAVGLVGGDRAQAKLQSPSAARPPAVSTDAWTLPLLWLIKSLVHAWDPARSFDGVLVSTTLPLCLRQKIALIAGQHWPSSSGLGEQMRSARTFDMACGGAIDSSASMQRFYSCQALPQHLRSLSLRHHPSNCPLHLSTDMRMNMVEDMNAGRTIVATPASWQWSSQRP